MSERTDHGFRIGAMEVTALAEWNRGSAVGIRAGKTHFDVQATPKGRDVAIVLEEGADAYLRVIAPNGDVLRISWSKRHGGYVSRFVDGAYQDGFPLDGSA